MTNKKNHHYNIFIFDMEYRADFTPNSCNHFHLWRDFHLLAERRLVITWKINNLIKSWSSEHRPKSLRNKLTRFMSFVPVRSPVFGSKLHIRNDYMNRSLKENSSTAIIRFVLCLISLQTSHVLFYKCLQKKTFVITYIGRRCRGHGTIFKSCLNTTKRTSIYSV